MSQKFSNLGIILPEELVAVSEIDERVKALFDNLTALDQIAKGADKENNIRIGILQDIIRQGLIAFKEKGTNSLIGNLSKSIDIVMAAEIADEGGFYEDKGFNYKQQPEQITADTPIDHKPINISNSGALRREDMYFVNQYGMNKQTIYPQPFIERSDEPLSIKFAEEYYKYCCAPTKYLRLGINGSGYDEEELNNITSDLLKGEERYSITPGILEEMEKRVGCRFSHLKIYKFFDTEYNDTIMPTHGLLCQMFLMCSLATAPFYLAGGHLGDPYENQDQFTYYTQFLIHHNKNIIPNRQGFITVLQILITILKNKKEHGSRLVEQEITIDELLPLMRAKNIGPFELYEDLLRDQFCLVDNITTGDTIGFKLTGTGMMFLYMCCPKI